MGNTRVSEAKRARRSKRSRTADGENYEMVTFKVLRYQVFIWKSFSGGQIALPIGVKNGSK